MKQGNLRKAVGKRGKQCLFTYLPDLPDLQLTYSTYLTTYLTHKLPTYLPTNLPNYLTYPT